MAIVYLARHGESVWNAARRVQGQQDVPLSTRGEAQAMALARRLRAERIDVVFTSDLQRAQRTAATVVAAQRQPPALHVRGGWRERHFGNWEGHTAVEVQVIRSRLETEATAQGRPAPAWWDGPPDGETFEQTIARVLRAWDEIATTLASGATVLLVSHAAALRALLCGLTHTPPVEQRRWQLDNAALSRMAWNGSVTVDFWNDTSHTADLSLSMGMPA